MRKYSNGINIASGCSSVTIDPHAWTCINRTIVESHKHDRRVGNSSYNVCVLFLIIFGYDQNLLLPPSHKDGETAFYRPINIFSDAWKIGYNLQISWYAKMINMINPNYNKYGYFFLKLHSPNTTMTITWDKRKSATILWYGGSKTYDKTLVKFCVICIHVTRTARMWFNLPQLRRWISYLALKSYKELHSGKESFLRQKSMTGTVIFASHQWYLVSW